MSITPGSTIVVFNAYDQLDSASGTVPEFTPFGDMTADLYDEAPWLLEEVCGLCKIKQSWVQGPACPCRMGDAGRTVELTIEAEAHVQPLQQPWHTRQCTIKEQGPSFCPS